MIPILLSLVKRIEGKEIPLCMVPSNAGDMFTREGKMFLGLLKNDQVAAVQFLQELCRGDSQKLRRLKEELIAMKREHIISFEESSQLHASQYRLDIRSGIHLGPKFFDFLKAIDKE